MKKTKEAVKPVKAQVKADAKQDSLQIRKQMVTIVKDCLSEYV